MQTINKNRNLHDLIESGLLEIAKLPQNNPSDLSAPFYTVSLIEHDYQAKTPVMWNAVYDKLQLDFTNVMVVCQQVNLQEVINVFRSDDRYLGGGIGVGFKDKVIDFLDELDPLARQMGAVNFVMKNSQGKLVGYNTDGIGYVKSLESKLSKKNLSLSGQKILMLGAGGTGNAIAFVLVDKGAELTILNRSVEKANALAEKINQYFKGARPTVLAGGEDSIAKEALGSTVVINVSTKGAMGEWADFMPLAAATLGRLQDNLDASNVVLQAIPKSTILSDVVLRDGSTPFLKIADEYGFEILDGRPMVILQGVEAFWLIHGKELQNKSISFEDVSKIMDTAANG